MKRQILIVSTHNSCRSLIAEAYMKKMAGSSIEIHSAGITPLKIDEKAIIVMKEKDLDISECKSKSVNEFIDRKFHFIITLSGIALYMCPIRAEFEKYHFNIEDAREFLGKDQEVLDYYRKIRDIIKNTCNKFLREFYR